MGIEFGESRYIKAFKIGKDNKVSMFLIKILTKKIIVIILNEINI